MSKPEFLTQISSNASVPPAWLDQMELQRLMIQDIPKFQGIESIKSRSEQFAQSALRVQIQAKLAANTTRTVNYLVKSQEECNGGTLKFARPHNFKMELHMHNVVLPALVELYKNVNRVISFSPSNFKPKSLISAKNSNFLYLDYLQAKGYRSANQPKGLDKSAMEAVLSKLAAYHAATACYLQLNPGQLKEFSKLAPNKIQSPSIEERKIWLQRKFQESLRSNNLREYEDKVKSYQKYLAGNIESETEAKRSFNVILIGACWPNNLLGNFDAFGHVKDSVFNDFSSSTVGPAIYDLLQLLLTAPAEKTELFDGFLRHYSDDLTAQLKLLKYQGNLPTLTDLQLELLNYGHWAFEVVTEILPILIADFGCDDIDDLFKTSKYSAEIKKLLPWLEDRAYFELE